MAWGLKFTGTEDGIKILGLSGLVSYAITLSHDMGGSGGGNYGRYFFDGRHDGDGYSGYIYNQGVSNVSEIQINGIPSTHVDVFNAVAGDVISFQANTSVTGSSVTIGAKGSGGNSLAFAGISKIEIIDSLETRILDATASDHSNTGAQPVLLDTVGGNNATGVGFPTDGSAWVDLGGSGAVTELIFSDSIAHPTSDSITLENITKLSLSDSLVQATSDNITLELIVQLVISDSTIQPTSGPIALQNIDELVFSGSLTQPTSNAIVLQNLTQLSFSNSTIQPTSDAITVTQQGNLSLFDSITQPTSDAIIISNIDELMFSDSIAQPNSDSITIDNITQLFFSDSTVQPVSDNIVIENAGQLIFSDSLAQPSSDTIAIELYTELVFSDSLVQPLSDSVNITTQVMPFFGNNDLLLIDNTIRYSLIDNTTDYRIK